MRHSKTVMKPFISIIIPVYNCEAYLERCLDSVFAQDYENYEVICIDDGSKDGSAEICKRYDVRYCYQENAGQAAARNKAIELAEGEWLCFVDADDAVEPDYLSALAGGIIDKCAMVVCRIKRINEDGSYNVDVLKKYGYLSVNEALVSVNIGPTNKLIRKDIIGDCRFVEGKLRFEDILFTPELIINAGGVNAIEDVLYDYYVRENSTMRRFDDSLGDIFTVLDVLKRKPFYQEYKKEIDYIIFKNALFGHLSRIVYFDKETSRKELKKAEDYVKKNVPDYWEDPYIRGDRQPYFYVGTRLFRIGLLWILMAPLRLMEKNVKR